MLRIIQRILKFILFALVTNIVYGIIIYFAFTWLVGYSLLLAYIGNLVIIVLALIVDELTLMFWQSSKLVALMKNEEDVEKSYNFIQKYFDGFVSFKTVLYLFYIIILVVSQIVEFYPTIISENVADFIFANRYSILILIAFDQLIRQFSKDRRRIRRIEAKLKRDLAEGSDQDDRGNKNGTL